MTVTLTVKLSADSREELIKGFGGAIEPFKAHVEGMVRQGAFGPPDRVNVRWLLVGGRHEGRQG